MKKIPLLIVILILTVLLAFWFYPTKKTDLSKYSDPDYAKHVELQAFFMTSEQVANLFTSNPNEIPSHRSFQEIHRTWDQYSLRCDQFYLVIRIKNAGSKYVSGEIICFPNLGGLGETHIPWLKPYEEKFLNLVRPILFGGVRLREVKIENPQLIWKQVYTKPNELD